MIERYDKVTKDQIEAGIVERTTQPVNSHEFYIPHKAVGCEAAESMKLCVVYDALARANKGAPFLIHVFDSII